MGIGKLPGIGERDDFHDKLEYHHDEDRELYIVITHESHPLRLSVRLRAGEAL